MIGLLLIRGGAVFARLVLSTGSQRAGWYYVAMEVSFFRQSRIMQS